ncbi:MAG: DUF1015 domain-containing protein [candidate division WOR-3 bacterium]|nr:MAG: DUF1015 domain-containing protein [candidate division WOR-3 bacterium]
MPELKPFQGIRYNPEQIEDLTDVICQPYDQISNKMERAYKNKSPYNFVRLVLTKYAEGHDRQREYRDAKKSLDQWTKDGIFIQDSAPSIYPYWQEFTLNDKTYVRKGFVCLVRLEELGKGNILPHEKTLSKPKADRLNLLRITHRDLEPVFLLYTDAENRVNGLIQKKCKDKPLAEVEDELKVTHKLWCIDDAKTVENVIKTLKGSIFVIADGHHRYETAYNYSTEMKTEGDHPANFKMITLVNIEDPGLVILPTHRLVKDVPDFSLVPFLEKTEKYFEITKTDREHITEHLAKEKSHAFGFLSAQTAYILKLKDKKAMKKKLGDRSAAYQDLDVAILHTLLIEDVLGITSETLEDHVRYERVVRTAMRRIDSGEFQFCFVMNPTRPEQVKEIAENKERMPQKSTDFFPKLISGLVHYDVSG